MEHLNAQKRLIRQHLLNGSSISALEALREYGCYRLGARISELRSEGMAIETTMEESISKITGKPVRFARYRLTETGTPEPFRGQQK